MTGDDNRADCENSPCSADRPKSDKVLLAEFLKDRDALCPTCGYNLRKLRSDVCPECETSIALRVGEKRIRPGLFVLTIAPGLFWGILAGILMVVVMTIGYPPPVEIGALIIGGFVSGTFAVTVACASNAFLSQTRSTQATCATIVWLVHFAVVAIVMTSL